MNRLKDLVKGLDLIIKQLRVEGEFQKKFLNIVQLAKSPFVQLMLANFNVDPKILDSVFNGLLHDKQVSDIIETVANIFECFSVNRFVGVQSEKELEDMALKLNEKKLFYAGVFFGNDGYDKNKEFSYKIRMDVDNTPITLENRNRFWFPGPNANFELEMRYHRGFIQIQHMVDQAIIKTVVEAENEILEQKWLATSTTTTTTESPTTTDSFESDSNSENKSGDSDSSSTDSVENENTTTSETEEAQTTQAPNAVVQKNDVSNQTLNEKETQTNVSIEPNRVSVETTTPTITTTPPAPEQKLVRKKRQFDIFSSILGADSTTEEKPKFTGGINYGDMHTYTKQFPYPKYRRDNFLTGLYLAQCIQLLFFFALIVQVSNAVRNRIWMRESGNSTVSDQLNLTKGCY